MCLTFQKFKLSLPIKPIITGYFKKKTVHNFRNMHRHESARVRLNRFSIVSLSIHTRSFFHRLFFYFFKNTSLWTNKSLKIVSAAVEFFFTILFFFYFDTLKISSLTSFIKKRSNEIINFTVTQHF